MGNAPKRCLARSPAPSSPSPPTVTIFPSLTSTNLDRVPGRGRAEQRSPLGRRTVVGRTDGRTDGRTLRFEPRQHDNARARARALHDHDRSLTFARGAPRRRAGGRGAQASASAGAGIPQVDTSLTTAVPNCHPPRARSPLPSQHKKKSE